MTLVTSPSPTANTDRRLRVPALDGVRGLAILAVFFFHYARDAGSHTSSSVVKVVALFFKFGWSGVDLFFVLSGFLITGILYDTLSDSGYYKKFYARRILRIFPNYYLVVIIFLVLTPFLKLHWQAGHLAFLVYLGYPAALIWPALVQFSPYVAITNLWSLSVEEQFYMIWPWVIAKLRKPEVILRACLVIAVAALALRVVITSTGWLNITWTHTLQLCRMDDIATGAAIAILVRIGFQNHLQRLAPWAFVLAACLITFVCVCRHSVMHDDPLIATLGFTLIAIMYGALLVFSLQEKSWIAWFFSIPVLRMFGKYSYGLYLYHFSLTVVLGPLKNYFIGWMQSYVVGATIHLAFNLAVNLLVAVASFHLFEEPIMKMKERFKYGGPQDVARTSQVSLRPAVGL